MKMVQRGYLRLVGNAFTLTILQNLSVVYISLLSLTNHYETDVISNP